MINGALLRDAIISAVYLQVTPGVKFTTGLVLMYDDMPELTAKAALSGNGYLQIGDISTSF